MKSAHFQRIASSVERIALILLFAICYMLYAAAPAHAQSNPYNTPNTNPDVPKNQHFWTQTVLIEVLSAATCQLAGLDPISPDHKCLGVDQLTGKIGFVENSGGAIGLMGNMIAMTYTPPLHMSDYTTYLAQNFGIIKPAYAQGVGFKGLTPLLPLWTAFRDLVYLIYVVVFAVIGLFIMLRLKIDPRTVMSISNQLPKLIVSILLVTFSFAISGFLIDMMYVSIYLTFNVFENPKISQISGNSELNKRFVEQVGHTQQTFNGDNALDVFNNLIGFQEVVTSSAGGVKDIVQDLFSTGAQVKFDSGSSGNTLIISWIFDAFKGTSDLIRNGLGAILGWIAGTLALVIIAIAILWAMIRLWFQLISSYVFFLIDVVTAPFWIIAGVFPGSPIGFSAWIRDMLSNIVVFPVTIVLLLMGKVFINAFSGQAGSVFVAPLIGNPVGGATSSASISPLGALIGLGIILITPQVVAIAKDLFKPPPFKYMAGVAKAISVGTGAFAAPGNLSSRYNQFMYYNKDTLNSLPGIGKLLEKLPSAKR